MKYNKGSMVLVLVLYLLIVGNALALENNSVPKIINYQGYLTDTDGKALNGDFKIVFSIYSGLEGGSPVWQETHNTVKLENGLFNVLLGAVDSTLSADILSGELYLGITVGDEDEMEPRLQLASAAFSLHTQVAEQAYTLSASDGDPSDAVYVNDDGNVGIGTTNPGKKLDVNGNMMADNMMIKIHDSTCTNVNAYTIENLDGNTHKIYKLYFHGTINDANTYLIVRPNSDDSAVNYRSWLRHLGDADGVNGGVFGLFLTRSWIGKCDVSGEVTLFCEAGRERFGHGQAYMWYTGSTNSLMIWTGGRWNNTTDNITELKITLTNISGLSVGTFSGRFILYALTAR
jgi:hypothetical protein